MSFGVDPGLRAVIFDAVGTLIFPHPSATEVYRALAARQGVQLPLDAVRQRFLEAFRIEEAADRESGWRTSERRERERWRTIVTATLHQLPDPGAAFEQLFEHFAMPTSWQVHDQAAAVFAVLRERGLLLGMGTNYDSRINRVIAGLPVLAPLADRVAVSAAIGFRKPAAEFFRHAARMMGCSPREILFVGDDEQNDYRGAIAAGLEAVLFDPREESTVPHRISELSELISFKSRDGQR